MQVILMIEKTLACETSVVMHKLSFYHSHSSNLPPINPLDWDLFRSTLAPWLAIASIVEKDFQTNPRLYMLMNVFMVTPMHQPKKLNTKKCSTTEPNAKSANAL